jgi:hypothetical protein
VVLPNGFKAQVVATAAWPLCATGPGSWPPMTPLVPELEVDMRGRRFEPRRQEELLTPNAT